MRQLILIAVLVAAVGAVLFFIFDTGGEPVANTPPKNDVIVAFGDSLVEGVGSDRRGGFVPLLEDRLGREIINLGVAGETTADGLGRIDEALAYDPGIAVVLFGGNDAMRKKPMEETATNLANIINRFHENGTVVVLLGVRGGLFGDPYDDMYEELSETFNTAYVPNVLEDILLRPELTYDQLHPNDQGYAIVAQRVAEEFERVLNSQTD